MKKLLLILIVLFNINVVEAEKVIGPYDSITDIYQSNDGKNIAFLAYKDGKNIIVNNGLESQGYDRILRAHVNYSPDGKSLAFIAERDGKAIVVKDSQEIIGYDAVYSPIFSENGSFVFHAQKEKKSFIVQDGKEGAKYDHIWDMLFLPGETGLLYRGENNVSFRSRKSSLILNGNSISNYDEVHSPTYSPDGKSFAYVGIEDGKSFIVKDGTELKYFQETQQPTYSPDGKSFAYVGIENNKMFVVKDGVKGKSYDFIGNLLYSPDSSSFSYVGVNRNSSFGDMFVVTDGVESKKYDSIKYLTYSYDGKEISYIGRTIDENNEGFVNILIKNGKEIDSYDSVGFPRYSPTENSFAFLAIKDGKNIIVKDGKEIITYEKVDNLTYSNDGEKFLFTGMKNGKYYLFEQETGNNTNNLKLDEYDNNSDIEHNNKDEENISWMQKIILFLKRIFS